MKKKKQETAIEPVEPKPIMVFDDDLGDYQEISVEQQNKAEAALRLLNQIELIKAFVLKMIHDEKLYTGMGCSSFRDFIARRLQFGKDKAYQYLKIANAYLPQFKHVLVDGKISTDELSNMSGNPDKVSANTDTVSEKKTELTHTIMGMSFGELLRGAEEVDFEEVETPDSVAEKLSAIKDKAASRLAKAIEELKLFKSESEVLQKENANLRERLARIEEAEALYGPRRDLIDSKRRTMDECRKVMARAEQLAFQINVDREDPVGLKKDMADMVSRVHDIHQRLINHYLFLAEELA